MKLSLKSILLFTILVVCISIKTNTKKRIVFFGDSITQMGVDSGGYISILKENLKQKNRDGDYELIGSGIGGNKVSDLYLRLDDVLALQPDEVVIWIGVNDVWHKVHGFGTDPNKFIPFYEAVIKKLQAKNIKLTLCTPATIGEKNDFSNQQDGDLNFYSNMIRELAKKHGCTLLDFRTIFHNYEVTNNKSNVDRGILTTDGVHLNAKGNHLVAENFESILFLNW